MTKRMIVVYALLILALTTFSACKKVRTSDSDLSNLHAFHVADFAGKKIGMTVGTIWEPIITDIAMAEPVFYPDVPQGYDGVRNREIYGFITDLTAAKSFVASPEGSDFTYAEIPFDSFNAPMGAVAIDEGLLLRFNKFLASLIADGTQQTMQNYWFRSSDNLSIIMPDIPVPANPQDTLRVATSDASMPFSYFNDYHELVGYSVELISRFAASENMAIELTAMVFGGMLPSVINKENDIAIADISITEERKKSVFFSEPIFFDQAAIVYLMFAE